MNDETKELFDALKMKIEALQIRNEALKCRLETIEMHFNNNYQALIPPYQSFANHGTAMNNSNQEKRNDYQEATSKSEIGKQKYANAQKELEDLLQNENYNQSTFRTLTKIFLTLAEQGEINLNNLNELLEYSRITIVRHTNLLKSMDLLIYVGSKKRGYYKFTPKALELIKKVEENVETVD